MPQCGLLYRMRKNQSTARLSPHIPNNFILAGMVARANIRYAWWGLGPLDEILQQNQKGHLCEP